MDAAFIPFGVCCVLFSQESGVMDKLESLSDDQLWTVVHQSFSATQDERLRELTARSKTGRLSDDEQGEMEILLHAFDGYVLLRSQALLLLKQRGYDVEHRLKTPQ
jgi:hypothetical protein